jgi:hypothetical protein
MIIPPPRPVRDPRRPATIDTAAIMPVNAIIVMENPYSENGLFTLIQNC